MKVGYRDAAPVTIEGLREADPLVRSIHSLGSTNTSISFNWLRGMAGKDRDLWSQLGRGRAVLSSTDELDQYLYSYGPMVEGQWRAVLKDLELGPEPVRFIDYGCGQGLAGLLLFDRFKGRFSRILEQVVLVEPSPYALVRADAVYKAIAPDAEVVCVNKGFDDLAAEDLLLGPPLDTFHVFSNVLDIESFDHGRLFDVLLQPGKHDLLAVSNDRDVAGGSHRINGLKKALEDLAREGIFKVQTSVSSSFRCGPAENPDKWSTIAWLASVEVPGD